LTTDQVTALTTAQVAALTTGQIHSGLGTAQIAVLSTNDIVALRTAQIAALSTAQINQGMTTNQLAALTTAQIVALGTAQIAAISTADITALTTAELAAMTTNQTLHGLTTAQIHAMTTTQIVALTFEQRRPAALTAEQVSASSKQVKAVATASTLREKVGGLVQAMASYDAQAGTTTGSTSTIPPVSVGSAGSLAVATNVSTIVDVLKRFDANGNPIAQPGITSAPNSTLNLTGVNTASNGFLATPGGK
jgi:hypothetical protein